jgi:hypothetical protein
MDRRENNYEAPRERRGAGAAIVAIIGAGVIGYVIGTVLYWAYEQILVLI